MFLRIPRAHGFRVFRGFWDSEVSTDSGIRNVFRFPRNLMLPRVPRFPRFQKFPRFPKFPQVSEVTWIRAVPELCKVSDVSAVSVVSQVSEVSMSSELSEFLRLSWFPRFPRFPKLRLLQDTTVSEVSSSTFFQRGANEVAHGLARSLYSYACDFAYICVQMSIWYEYSK